MVIGLLGISFIVRDVVMMANDYYPLHSVLKKSSFNRQSDGTYQSQDGILSLKIDRERLEINKNDYLFSLDKEYLNVLGREYISANLISKLLQKEPVNQLLTFNLKDQTYRNAEWLTLFPRLIAHAGGTYREPAYNTFYTNSLEALRQNYALGHRVFEFDFSLTSDGQLAVVHDWDQFGYMNGQPLSSEEWRNFQTFGSPVTESRFTTMLIEDLLDQMMINKDLFIVTDTKLTHPSEEMTRQFQAIYTAAMARDSRLLDRIIPQIYSEEMYDYIKTVYDFPSIIYTLYAVGGTPDRVLTFVSEHKDIKVVTVPISWGSDFVSPAYAEALHQHGAYLYAHTIHTYDELTTYSALGIDGFYTGLLLPRDYDLLKHQ